MGLCLSIVFADCCYYWLLRISVGLRNRNAVCELVVVIKKTGKIYAMYSFGSRCLRQWIFVS